MPPKQVLLLLCNGTERFEAAAFVDVLGWSGVYGSEVIDVVTVGPRPEVTCTFGMRVWVERVLADVVADDFEALAIPGGFERFSFQADAYSPEVQLLISAFLNLGRPIASIGIGALPLAKTGALVRHSAATYHLMGGRRRRELPSSALKSCACR